MSKGSKKIELIHSIPVPVGNKEEGTQKIMQVSVITLIRLKAKHLKLLPKDFKTRAEEMEAHELLPLLAGLSELPLESIEEIDAIDDLPKVAQELTNFLDQSPVTGKKVSGG